MKQLEGDFCPHCGEEIRRGAMSCPHCGSDEETGWSENRHLDGIDLGDDDFSYEEMLGKEFGKEPSRPPQKLWIYVTSLVILALSGLGLILMLRR
ncbi:MAG: zinc ribbon domain-containing protein [Chitinispirillaceae bacterium]